MQRPLGVTLIAILSAIGGVFGLLAALVLLGAGAGLSAATGLGGLTFVGGVIILAYAILSLVLAYGFWNLKPWAWPLGVGVQALGVVQSVLQFMNDGSNVFGLVFSLAIAGIILWYLFQPHVKSAFGRA